MLNLLYSILFLILRDEKEDSSDKIADLVLKTLFTLVVAGFAIIAVVAGVTFILQDIFI